MGERFLQYLRVKGISQKTISSLAGVQTSLVSRFCSGGNINSDSLLRLVQACDDLSLYWLFFGSGEMFRSHAGTVINNHGTIAGSDLSQDTVNITNSENISVGDSVNAELFNLLHKKDLLISEKDSVISKRDETIHYLYELLGK